jgi:hypothetical protein
MKKRTLAVGIVAAVAALSACSPSSPTADKNYHGTVGGTPAPAPISTFSTPSVPAVPVTITGSGEDVKTAELVATGYTVNYQATSWTLIVKPVLADGSEGSAIINAMGQNSSGGVTGTTTYKATGRTTFHVSNTKGPWSLTFTPLS